MAERRVSTGKRRLALFMVSTALVSASAGASNVRAQDVGASPVANGPRAISIPAQPLDAALRAFTRQTGWQVGYAAALVLGRTSGTVAGETDPLAALRALIAGAGIDIRVTGARTASLVATGRIDEAAAGTTVLEEITVSSSVGGVKLGTESAADTGTTVLDSTQVGIRTSSADANSFLRGLPNVQYQDDTNDEAGVEGQAILNTRPQEVSISGGRPYENNFILNGIGINTITGTEEPYGANAGELSDDDTSYDANRIYGLHSQTIFVPTDFVEQATVIDSNASARFGSFQGGVVEYTLKEPATDRLRATASVDYQNDAMVDYQLATEDGTNPNEVDTPEFFKRKSAFSVTGPIMDNIAVIGQYSVTDAWTNKPKAYIYGDELIESESKNQFYRLQANAETDFGLFKLEGMHTDYHQDFQSDNYRDLEIDTATQTYAGKLQNTYEFEDFALGGIPLANVSLTSKITASKSDTLNQSGDDIVRNWQSTYFRSGVRVFETSMLDWCRIDPTSTTSTACREGGLGSERRQGQERYTWSQDLSGDVFNGTFNAGYEFGYTQARRVRAKDYVNYTYRVIPSYASGSLNLWQNGNGITSFTCNTTEECYAEQFASSKGVWKAYDIKAQIMPANSYFELDQTFDWLNIRPGIRLDYDDYQGNLNIAPRLVATVTPIEQFSISGGYNRYYNAANLAYAIRDQQPRQISYSRNPSTTGVVGDFTTNPDQAYYSFDATDLETPYTDEFTAAINFTDPLTDGDWRFRYIHRNSRAQYATAKASTNEYVLTNGAEGSYDSVTAEYARELPDAAWNPADSSVFAASITWAANNVSSNSYFVQEDELEERISYKGMSYTQAGFNAVTGNMDIPLRAQFGLTGSFFDERLTLGLSANYNFAYEGVADSGDNEDIDGIQHDIWEDKAFDAVLTVDLTGSYKVASIDEHGLTLNFKVVNLFNELGNGTAENSQPWVIGRTLWLGASAEF
jgi:hypothetical protein